MKRYVRFQKINSFRFKPISNVAKAISLAFRGALIVPLFIFHVERLSDINNFAKIFVSDALIFFVFAILASTYSKGSESDTVEFPVVFSFKREHHFWFVPLSPMARGIFILFGLCLVINIRAVHIAYLGGSINEITKYMIFCVLTFIVYHMIASELSDPALE